MTCPSEVKWLRPSFTVQNLVDSFIPAKLPLRQLVCRREARRTFIMGRETLKGCDLILCQAYLSRTGKIFEMVRTRDCHLPRYALAYTIRVSGRLGVKTRVFHLGDYRRATVGPGRDVPDDYFFINGIAFYSLNSVSLCGSTSSFFIPRICYAVLKDEEIISHLTVFLLASASSVLLRQKILRKCREDIYHFFNHENGQIAIYDAVNPLAAGRRSLAKEFAKHDVQVSLRKDLFLGRLRAKIRCLLLWG